ncbi:MAG TPA: winged helix DNA-binding domain-containing protein [Candidatus Limnocylindrales bacterium]|nr:winged helix DNA-binding domain-containing protein [Candidatus Limnocylindrales bacterium]
MARRTPAAIRLDPRRVAAWRLGRQLIAPATATSPEEIAKRLVGVQAQVVSAAALAVALRSDGLTIDSVPAALAGRRLVRAWAMRGTLHAFDADDYPVIVGALRRRDTWRRPVWFRYFEVTEPEMEALIEAVGVVLDDARPRTRRELAEDVGRRLGRNIDRQLSSSWGTLLKPAADRGYLIHAAGEGNAVTFTRPSRWIGRWREVDPDQAIPLVLRRYLAVYGPASTHEVRRWWGGLRSTFIRTALESLGETIVTVDVDGSQGLLAAADIPGIEATEPFAGSVHLLGPFDPFIVGAGARDALIPSARYGRVSRTAGWISAVVLIDGVVGGIWTSSRAGDQTTVTVELFDRVTRTMRRRLAAAVDRLGVRLGTPVTLAFGPVHADQPASVAGGADAD